MKAIVYDRYGPPEVLRYADVAQPTIGDDEVLVQVRAASINFGDRAAMRGIPSIMRLAIGLRRPKQTILGRDIAGVVSAVGTKVTRFRVGDEVLGEMEQRGFAEYVAAPEQHLVTKPVGVTFEQAATLPVAGTTAVQAVRLGKVAPGRTVLVNGASGGVGTFTVQIAAALGAEVTGACSARNMELVRSIGADHVIDYTRQDITRRERRFDVIVDLAGDHRIGDFRRVLTPAGVYISSTGAGGRVMGPLPRMVAAMATSPFGRGRLSVLAAKRNADDLAHLAAMVADGTVSPVIERTYPLGQAADAIRFIEAEHAKGKVVLTVP